MSGYGNNPYAHGQGNQWYGEEMVEMDQRDQQHQRTESYDRVAPRAAVKPVRPGLALNNSNYNSNNISTTTTAVASTEYNGPYTPYSPYRRSMAESFVTSPGDSRSATPSLVCINPFPFPPFPHICPP
jgi:hypothetical protein